MMKHLSILGSTGSIGKQTLDIVKNHSDKFSVKALSCNSNIELLKKQIDEFKPEIVAVFDEEKADLLKTDIEIVKGMKGLLKVAKHEGSDTLVNSLVGSIGILPTVEGIKSKKNIALANKETLVSAGEIVMDLARKHEVALTPIDSEHSAIFQCIRGEEQIKSITLTCSGGPFREYTKEQLKNVTLKDALNHPNWNMGPKITIDSATLMNKGLEVIEAKMLFDLSYDQIHVAIHPQSIVHSLVEFSDTSIKAQLGFPDMKIPIQYALTHPKRFSTTLKSFDITKHTLTFKEPDLERFPCLSYAYDAGKKGGSMPCALNAANEVAVKKFLQGEIQFLEISKTIKEKMENHAFIKNPNLDELLALDNKIKND